MGLICIGYSIFTSMKSGVFLLIFLFTLMVNVFSQSKWGGNTSPTYSELIQHLKNLDKSSDRLELYAMGESDVVGVPIYICILNGTGDSALTMEKAKHGTTLLFNNAIHPGEPDGINACLMYADKYITLDSINTSDPLVAFIPAYNVGGMMVRSSNSRANQNGPIEYGFRGNAQNLDLNRDFLKMDSENSKTFSKIFHALDPDIFVDNHVSNGADYQYTLTYISPVRERLAPSIRQITYGLLLPKLTQQLKVLKWDLFPYVETKKETPDSGIVQFNDLPRYAMGYASLFHTISFTVETHMLKPFPSRVKATFDFMNELIKWTVPNQERIEISRDKARQWEQEMKYFKHHYELADEKDSISFKGYAAIKDSNQITGLYHLKYDQSQSYVKTIPFYHKYIATDSSEVPSFYIIRGQEKRIIQNLKDNGILFEILKRDVDYYVNCNIIKKYNSLSKPYEGHFMHSKIELEKVIQLIHFKPGDIVVPTNQNGSLLVHSMFQVKAEDSYFTWNYFDSYLQEKEYFSNYVFIEKIKGILNSDPELRQEFEEKKQTDSEFASSEWQQLYYIYQRSPYFEPSYMMLPVFELK